ncbi:hypothetical protein R3X27_20740 [Tropicimonas sp. TH_r6]|uniref:MotE family protein n=1 Tax=Tropicimonas sp. TH_r6 TaxID=3082085 RepID=UPI0029548933|nr:hypothetical protein [Tropicimonas sp. TH_r6]MDV7145116.1 hypothetical protein [Tropicimonas sp. TH_r6]
MTARTKKRRPGRGTLLVIGALFFASGVIRLADGTGNAVAREVEAFTTRPKVAPAEGGIAQPLECATEDGLGQALSTVRERMAELDEREKQVEYRMVTLQRAEEEIQRNLAAMVQAEESLSATIAQADGAAERDIERLIAVYEKMKPKEAANLFEAMDPTFAAGFLARLRPDVSAAIMAGMSPAKAYSVSILLAGRNTDVPTE